MTATNLVSKSITHSYDRSAKRFRDKATGKFLSQSNVNRVLDDGFTNVGDKIQKSAERHVIGQKSPDLVKFSLEVSEHLKDLHIISAVRANGGRADTFTPDQMKALQTRIAEQLTKGRDKLTGDRFGLIELVKDINRGDVSDAQLKNRLNMFVKSAELTKFAIDKEAKKANGFTKGLRILGSNHDHCGECIGYASLGWVKLKDLILPGQNCSCRSNCLCGIQYK